MAVRAWKRRRQAACVREGPKVLRVVPRLARVWETNCADADLDQSNLSSGGVTNVEEAQT
jgi:hypothetical protein